MIDPSQIKAAAPFKDALKNVLKEIGDEFSNFFEIGVNEYIEDRFQKISLTSSFIFQDKVDFYEIYFPLTLRGKKRLFTSDKMLLNLFEDSNTVAIVGTAGSGKTMLLKHVFLSYYHAIEKVPIFIELRDFNNNLLSFEDYIFKIILNNRIKPNQRILENALKSGKFVFIFDGFDEIGLEIKPKLVIELESFIDRFPENKFLFSSRPGTNIEAFPRLVVFNVQSLTRSEIDSFIEVQLKNKGEDEVIRKLKETINNVDNKSYLHYISNPLLLSMFILTFRNYPELPKSKNKFYWNVFDTLCTKHDSVTKKGAYSHEKKTKLQNEDFEKVLKTFCYITLIEQKFNFDRQYLTEKLRNVRDKLGYNFNVDDLIYDFSVSISIITQEGLDYKFPHRTLQDYFTVLFVKDQPDESKKRIYKEKLKRTLSSGYAANRDLFDLFIELDKESFYENRVIPLFDEFEATYNFDDIYENIYRAIKDTACSINIIETENKIFEVNGGRRNFVVCLEIGSFFNLDFPYYPRESTNKTQAFLNQMLELGLMKMTNRKTSNSDKKVKDIYTIDLFNLTKDQIVSYIEAYNLSEIFVRYFRAMKEKSKQIKEEYQTEKASKISIWDF